MSLDGIDVKVIDKIKKLFNLAADPSNVNEATLAATMAQQLLLKHKLAMADVMSAEAKSTFNTILEYDIKFERGLNLRECPEWKRLLGAIIARHHFSMLFTTPDGLRFVGTEEDLAVVNWLYGFLSTALVRLAHAAWTKNKAIRNAEILLSITDAPRVSRGEGLGWKRQFYYGACQALDERFKSMRKAEEINSTQERQTRVKKQAADLFRSGKKLNELRALVESWAQSQNLVTKQWSDAQKRLDDYVKEKYPNAEIYPEVNIQVEADPFERGFRAGTKIPLHKPLAQPEPNLARALKTLLP